MKQLSIGHLGTKFSAIVFKIQTFRSQKCIWKYRLRNVGHFVLGEVSWLGAEFISVALASSYEVVHFFYFTLFTFCHVCRVAFVIIWPSDGLANEVRCSTIYQGLVPWMVTTLWIGWWYTPPTKSLWTLAPARNPWQASSWKADISRTKHRRLLKFWSILYHMVF